MTNIALQNGGSVTQYADHPDLPARVVRVSALTIDTAADGIRLRLSLPSRDQLAATATATGSRLADALPASLVLLLAAVAVRDDLPDTRTVTLLHHSATQMLPPHVAQPAENASLGEIRSFVREAITAGPQQRNVDTALRVPAGRWNVARAILLYGEELWRVRGDVAAWWGSSIISDDPAADGAILLHIATTVMQRARSPIPIPFAEGRPGEAIIDYLAVASGPDPIPADVYDRGLGATLPAVDALFFGNASEERAIGWQQATELSRLAISLLRDIDRPAPRYLGQSLTVALPPDLLPKLGAFGVVGMRVYPRSSGMYVAVTDRENQTIAAAWWAAVAASGERNPNTFSPACWLLTHVVCAALWHDLCADAVEISALPPTQYGRSDGTRKPERTRPERTSRLAVLPPPRYKKAEWGTGEDAERIRQIAHYRTGDYRRLPTGYEEREDSKGFQARQREAAGRAQSFGYPEPPPGYTFVKPHVRGTNETEEDAAITTPSVHIRSRGLFSLMLGLAQQRTLSDK